VIGYSQEKQVVSFITICDFGEYYCNILDFEDNQVNTSLFVSIICVVPHRQYSVSLIGSWGFQRRRPNFSNSTKETWLLRSRQTSSKKLIFFSNITSKSGMLQAFWLGWLLLLIHYTCINCRWDVPLPHALRAIYMHREGTDPRFIKLEPVFKCSMLKRGSLQRYFSFILFLTIPDIKSIYVFEQILKKKHRAAPSEVQERVRSIMGLL
jgi:hypothetical protein